MATKIAPTMGPARHHALCREVRAFQRKISAGKSRLSAVPRKLRLPGIAGKMCIRDRPYPIDVKLQPPCNCVHVLQDGKWIDIDGSNPNLVPPGFTKMVPNPALDQMAIDAKISGTITFIYQVSDMGRVDELWLAKPLSSALDESAAKTCREDMFKPCLLYTSRCV